MESINLLRDVQVYGEIGRPGHKFYNFNEWELPRGAMAEMIQWAPTISVPQELSGQLTRIYARFVWAKEIPRRPNRGVRGKGAGGLYQFVAKVSFDSADRRGYLDSVFLRMSG